jgi:hypothetical protein
MSFVSFMFLTFMLIVPAMAHADGYPKEWFQCASDLDCLKTRSCADIAINKNYFQELKKTMTVGCDATGRPNPNTVAKCVNGECDLVIPDQQE